MRALFRVVNRYVGNLPAMGGGMPQRIRISSRSAQALRITGDWRGWLKSENRCLVPFKSFAEYAPEPNAETTKKDVVWFARNEDRPLAAFRHLDHLQRRPRHQVQAGPGPHLVYGFLTTAPNAVVEP